MVIIVKRPLCIGYGGMTKTGKSHLAARFCKLNDKPSGIHVDFSRIFMKGGFDGTTPKYITQESLPQMVNGNTEIEVGEAYAACSKVGLDIENQYKLVLTWDDFVNVIEYAKFYQQAIERKKLWLVLDDMVGLRWHKVIDISVKAKHKSVAKDDWKVASSEIKLLISQLSKEFNLLLINQMAPVYKGDEKTGEIDTNYIPAGAEYLYDGLFTIAINKETTPRKQFVEVLAGRDIWQCDDSFNPIIQNPTPEAILKALDIAPDRW